MARLDPQWLLMRVKLRSEMKSARRLPVPVAAPRVRPQEPQPPRSH
jgi:hypothetical protein